MPEILCMLGSDYFPSPHAGFAGEQINYVPQHNALPIQMGGWRGVGWQELKVKLSLQAGSECSLKQE